MGTFFVVNHGPAIWVCEKVTMNSKKLRNLGSGMESLYSLLFVLVRVGKAVCPGKGNNRLP
jgi:hypothetical protein